MSGEPENQTEDLRAFLEKHVRPYDPATDDYERPPFAADIKEGKNDPIYNAHSYHTKVPPRSIIPYILHYTKPGDVVLDPFCGSGMTGVAAQMCANPPSDILDDYPELQEQVGSRTCVLNDLSTAACHIAYNYNTPVSVEALRSEFERIKKALEAEFAQLYGTEHYEPAVGAYAPTQPEVAARLKNPSKPIPANALLADLECSWELLSRDEVERRLGYPVSEVPRSLDWDAVEVGTVQQWICIPAMVEYTIWSDVYRCEGLVSIDEPTGKVSTRGKNAGSPIVEKRRVARGCGREIVLRNASLVHGHEDRQGSTFTCPHCNTSWQKSPLPWLRSEPVEVRLAWRDKSNKTKTRVRPISLAEILLAKKIPPSGRWFPSDQLYANRELLTMGAGKRGIKCVADFYFPRQLTALSGIFAQIELIQDVRVRRAALFAFTAIALKCSRLNRLRPSGAGDPLTGTLYIGSLVREENVCDTWQRRVDVILAAFERRFDGHVFVRKGNAAALDELPDNSVDFVFADPPFGGNIFYADASIMWEGWLRNYTDVTSEMVIHRRSKAARVADGFVFKELADYTQDMQDAFREMFRVLKPCRWAVIEFNNSDGIVFEAIKTAATAVGFQIESMLLLDKKQRSFKQVQGSLGKEEVVDKDVLFNLHKPAETPRSLSVEDRDLEQQVAEAVRQHLATLPERITAEPTKYSDDHRTTATINSMLMNTLIPRGVSVEKLNLPFIERVCTRFFRKVGQRWYLRGEAVGGNGGELMAEEAPVTDELSAIAWLRQKFQARPMLIGELKPHWMKATGLLPAAVSRQLDLELLLLANFWRDAASNRWREPTADEREKMNDDRSLRVLHDAARLASGTLGRTPPGSELCDWIGVLFDTCREFEEDPNAQSSHLGFDKTEAYRLIVKLSHHLTSEGIDPATLNAAKKQAAVAGRRLADEADSTDTTTSTKRRKDDNQIALDLGI